MLGLSELGQYPLGVAGQNAEQIAVTEDSWHVGLSEPVRFRRDPRAARVLAFASGGVIDPYALTQPESVTLDRWQQPLSEPRRFKKGLAAHQHPHHGFVQAAPFAESVTVDRWLLPLSEPVRLNLKTRLPYALHPHHGFVKAEPFAETVPIDRWLLPLAEPVRFKKGLRGHLHPHHGFVQAAPFEESVTVDRWLLPLTEPRRFKRGLNPVYHPAFTTDAKGYRSRYARGYIIT